MQPPNSPLFPASQLTLTPAVNSAGGRINDTLIPTLPPDPLVRSGSIEVYVIPSEKCLFIQGFESNEYDSRPPALLRGCLYVRILKPTKIKSIQLVLKGIQRTEWPEGIPPKKTIYSEVNDIVSHTWPFYQLGQQTVNNGADFFKDTENATTLHSLNSSSKLFNVPLSPLTSISESITSTNFFARSLSPSFMKKSNSTESIQATSDDGTFAVGDYIYNFEHPLQSSIPETCNVTFGSVYYYLEVNITRIGTFKSNINAKFPVEVIRTPSFSDTEENEPIVITREWDDQLKYDIVIGAKSVVLDSYLPLAIRFIPLFGKVKVHRIRVYITENIEYYCQNKKVHRIEPPKKYLLLEHKASKGNSLLSKDPQRDISNDTPLADDEPNDDILNKELEFQLFIPSKLSRPGSEIKPDTSFTNIQVHHWIKICLRISKTDPDNPEKRKHYEISIDSPIHILSSLAAHGNTLLPVYDDLMNLPDYSFNSPPASPGVIPVEMGRGAPSSISAVMESTRSKSNVLGLPLRRNSNSSTTSTTNAGHSHSVEPVFRHITTTGSNEQPFDRDADMHLDANLYKPDPENSNHLLHSPQATPYSPVSAPITRPIHLLRKPSYNPPPFSETNTQPPIANTLPPAYEQEFSMSPLRINDNENDDIDEDEFHLPINSGNDIPIHDLLRMRLNAATTGEQQSIESLTEDHSGNNQSSAKSIPEIISAINNSAQPIPTFQFSNTSQPESIRETETQQISPVIDEADITDLPSPLQSSTSPVLPSSRGSFSRRSSISSIGSDMNNDLDQTFPLLSMSTSSVAVNSTIGGNSHGHGSVASLFDPSRRLTSTKIMDLGESNNFNLESHLKHIKNPRLQKVQNESMVDSVLKKDENLNGDSRKSARDLGNGYKTYGVIQSFDDNSSGELQINPEIEQNRDSIAGFNKNYVI